MSSKNCLLAAVHAIATPTSSILAADLLHSMLHHHHDDVSRLPLVLPLALGYRPLLLSPDVPDAAAGCSNLTYNITTGLPNVAGAKFVLNVGFQPGAFVFLNQTEGNMWVLCSRQACMLHCANTALSMVLNSHMHPQSRMPDIPCRSTSKNNVSSSPPVISVYEALLRIESRQFLREMNATLDYSYLDTPRSGAPIRWLACNDLRL